MKATGRYNDERWSRTLLTYTFGNGSYIEFFSADQDDKVRGPRRNILYINECNNISFETYHQLAIRTDMEVWLDFNPTHEFWIHTELKDDPDSEELILTYKDNTALAESIVREIEKALHKGFYKTDEPDLFKDSNIKNQYWSNWWRVYGLGLVGSLEGVIFSNWSQIGKVPEDAQLLGYGLDFGFSNDPTALTAVYRWNNQIVLDELIYKTGMLNSDIIREMNSLGIDQRALIYADSAEPKTIEEIRRSGFNIHPTVKGADSINFGISILQEQAILVSSNSINLIKELRNYIWDKDKNGAKLNKPIDAYNHAIDSIRYFAMMSLKKKASGFVISRGKVYS
jgi:phage terminase large subunit